MLESPNPRSSFQFTGVEFLTIIKAVGVRVSDCDKCSQQVMKGD